MEQRGAGGLSVAVGRCRHASRPNLCVCVMRLKYSRGHIHAGVLIFKEMK